MYKLFLTVRYLLKPLSLIAIVALAGSVMILCFAPSIMNGFQREFRARMRGSQSDVTLQGYLPLAIERSAALEERLSAVPGVVGVAPFIEHPAIDRHFRKVDYCFIRAVVPALEEKASEFRSFILYPRDRYLMNEEVELLPADKRAPILELASSLVPGPSIAEKELADARAVLEAAERQKDVAQAGRLLRLKESVADAEVRLKRANAYQAWVYRALEQGLPDPDDPTRRLPAVMAGAFFMRSYNLTEGDVVKLTTAASEGGEVQQDRRFVICCGFRTGTYQTDRRILIMGLEAAQTFIGVKNFVSGYSIKLVNYDDAAKVLPDLERARRELSGTRGGPKGLLPRECYMKTWEERDENLVRAVGMEKLLIRLITMAIVVAASCSIFVVLYMSVQNKVRELGILRAVGGTRSGALAIFMGQGVLIAICGLVLGCLLGLLLAYNVNEVATVIHRYTGWHPFPPDVYYLERIPAQVEWRDIVENSGLTLLLGAFMAFFPALVAALRPPIRAIRYDS